MVLASRDLDHSLISAASATVSSPMDGFSILTNRRRAIVALAHSVVFLLIAVRQLIAANPAAGIWVPSTVSPGTWILSGIFVVVSSILFLALTHFPRMDGKILFRILHHQRRLGPRPNRCRRSGISRRPLYKGGHAGQRGSGGTADRAHALPPSLPRGTGVRRRRQLDRRHLPPPLLRFLYHHLIPRVAYIAESELYVSAIAFQLPSACLV